MDTKTSRPQQRRWVKEFAYRGIPKEELENMSLEKLFQLFNARQRRSLTRGITDGKRKTN